MSETLPVTGSSNSTGITQNPTQPEGSLTALQQKYWLCICVGIGDMYIMVGPSPSAAKTKLSIL